MDDTKTEAPRWPWILRALYALSLLAFLLPFTTVKSCSTKEVKEYTGAELVAEGDGAMLLILVLTLIMLGLSFIVRRPRPPQDGLFHSGRSFWAVVALLVVTVGVSLQHLFDAVSARIGQWLCAGSWAVVLLLSLTFAWRAHTRMLRHAPSLRGHALKTARWVGLLLVAAVLLAFFAPRYDQGEERFAGALLAFVLGAPLAAVLYFAVMVAHTRVRAGRDDSVDAPAA